MEDLSQLESPNSLEKGKDTTTREATKRGGTENKVGEDPIMSHRAKELV